VYAAPAALVKRAQ